MSENDNILEGTRVLSITDANGRHKEFISEVEKEVSGFKLKYYMWLSRLFILFAVVSLMIFMSSSLALFKLAPQVSVEPFLIIRQDTSDGIVRYEPILEEIRKLPSGASMDQLKDRWYRGRDGSDYHYHQSRYHALNLHSVFYHGTVEWRLFNSTLHAGEAKANIILAMAISAQGINQKYTQFRKTPIGDNPAFTFRTFLLRLGLIGPEYKNVRMHLLKNLPGDKAWRHDKSLYPSNQARPRTDEVR